MRVQRMCRRLVLLLLAAACLCQMALAVDPAFRYGSKNVSWVEMDGDDFLLLDGDEADRDHPAAYAGDWMKVNLPTVSYTHLDVYKRQFAELADKYHMGYKGVAAIYYRTIQRIRKELEEK